MHDHWLSRKENTQIKITYISHTNKVHHVGEQSKIKKSYKSQKKWLAPLVLMKKNNVEAFVLVVKLQPNYCPFHVISVSAASSINFP